MKSVATIAAAAMTALPDPATLGTELEEGNKLVVTKLANVAISTTADCQQAVIDRQEIATRSKKVEEFFDPFISLAHKLHRALCDRKNEVLAPLLRLDQQLRGGIQAFKEAEDRKRREEERRLADLRRKEEEARLAAEAAALEAAGDHALAAAVIESAISAPAPVVALPDVTKKVEGLKFRTEWKWRYVNDDAARALALIPREYLSVDEKKIGAYVRSMKATGKIPGIQIYSEQVPVR